MHYKCTKKVIILLLILTGRCILNCKGQKMFLNRILEGALGFSVAQI
jgi:hypothetical protein